MASSTGRPRELSPCWVQRFRSHVKDRREWSGKRSTYCPGLHAQRIGIAYSRRRSQRQPLLSLFSSRQIPVKAEGRISSSKYTAHRYSRLTSTLAVHTGGGIVSQG